MEKIHINSVMNEFSEGRSVAELIKTAAGVANAIHAGIGGMIKGTMMEDDLRKALGLEDGQMVTLPKCCEAKVEWDQNEDGPEYVG